MNSQPMIKCVVLLIAISVFFIVSPFPTASAVPTVAWNFGTYSLSDGSVGSTPNQITVDDPVAAGSGSVKVNLTSSSDPVGIPLTLTETATPGEFKNTNIIFSNTLKTIPIGSTVTVSLEDSLANLDPSTVETLDAIVLSTSDNAVGITVHLNETGTNSSIFTGKVAFTTSPSAANHIQVAAGDEVSITDTFSGLVTNAIITPNADPGFTIITADVLGSVTAHYLGQTATVSIIDDTCRIHCGGGTGGIFHPGLVLDVFLASIGGSPYIVSPPSFGGGYYHYSDGLTLTQGKNTTTFDTSQYNQEIPAQVMISGKPVNMTFKTFESYNIEGVIHMGLYFIPRGEDMVTDNSIGSIVWEKGEPVEVNDPNHILSNAAASSDNDGKFQHTRFSFTPTKSYDKMSFLVRAWNDHLYSTDIRVHDDVVTPPPAKTLPPGVIQYDNFADLQVALEKDQFNKPELLSHIHGTSDVFPNYEGGSVYWLYDTNQHIVTLVVADKNDNALSSKSATLQPYAVEKKGDYGFMHFTVQQLNRWNEDQLNIAMELEATKAMSMALEKGIISHSNW